MAEELKPSPVPSSQFIDGLQMPNMFSADCVRSAIRYKPRDDDLILVTYPKCGTTWAQHTLVLIFSHGDPITDPFGFHTSAPFLEMTGAEGADSMPRPGAIKVHLPYHLTPRSDKAKYIYITRNPMDCCVSYFHHMRGMPIDPFIGTFDDFFECFISGNTDYGDYFDHLLGWYAHRNDPNVLFMTYEEMKEDKAETVLRMASFIDDELYAEPLRNDPTKLQNVIKYSSFDYMKGTVNKSMDELFKMSKEDIQKVNLPQKFKDLISSNSEMLDRKNVPPKLDFVRKGIIGDWKNYFTEEQGRRLKEKFAERTKGTDIPSLFEKHMV